jgi:hypothetical protein
MLHLSQWRLTINTGTGLSWVYATQGQQTLGGSLQLLICEHSSLNKTEVRLGGTHTRTSKIGSLAITGDISDDSLIQTHAFSKPSGAGVYAIADAYLNNSLGLVLQRSVGLGVFSQGFCKGCSRDKDGNPTIDTDDAGNVIKPTLTFKLLADVRYLNQRFYGISQSKNLFGTRLNENSNYQWKKFGFDEQFWIIPTLNDIHALQMYASGGPSYQLSPYLCMSVAEEEHYLGNAPPGKRRNYLSSNVKLTIQRNSTSCK